MHRFYVDPSRISSDTAYLTAEDARHALTVLRLRKGQKVEVFAGSLRYAAEIVSTDREDVLVRLFSLLPSTEPSLSVTLFQGLPKSDKMDLIVQKAAELGVSRIVPLNMERCIVKSGGSESMKKLERWRRIAREAGKQSGRSFVPDILSPCSLRELSGLRSMPEINVVPWEEADRFGPLAFHSSYPAVSSLGILIGPEGGISQDEVGFLRSMGFIPITLGKRILRTETAGLAAVSAFMSLYGEME